MAFFDSRCLRFNDICFKMRECLHSFMGVRTRHYNICGYIYSILNAFFFLQVYDSPSRVIKFVYLHTPFKNIYPPPSLEIFRLLGDE